MRRVSFVLSFALLLAGCGSPQPTKDFVGLGAARVVEAILRVLGRPWTLFVDDRIVAEAIVLDEAIKRV